ncbi:transposase [Hydrogenophaga sp. ANAO-22]|mgnify:CR=1 FL=1
MAHRGGSKCPKVAGGLTVLPSHSWLAARHVNSGKFVWPREAATTAKPGNGKTHRAYLWAYGAFENTKSVVYDLCESRVSEHVRTFLGTAKGGLALRHPIPQASRDAVQLTCTVPGATIRLAHGTPDVVGGYWFICCKRPVILS